MQFQRMTVLVADASSQKNSDKGGNNVIPVILVYSRLPCHTVSAADRRAQASAVPESCGQHRTTLSDETGQISLLALLTGQLRARRLASSHHFWSFSSSMHHFWSF
jgi:hypothetical protein